MTKEVLKTKYPELYQEVFQEGVMQERKKVQSRIEAEKAFEFQLN